VKGESPFSRATLFARISSTIRLASNDKAYLRQLA
jgi:hypothetical protein